MDTVAKQRRLTTFTEKQHALLELVAFIALALLSKLAMDPIAGAYAGPVSLIATLVILTVYMSIRAEKWSGMGLIALPGKRAKLMLLPQAVLIFISVLVTMSLLAIGMEAIGVDFLSETPEGELERWVTSKEICACILP